MSRGLHTKVWRKTNYRHLKQYGQHKEQQNENNQKTKIGIKTMVWTFYVPNKQHLTRGNVDMAKKGKP